MMEIKTIKDYYDEMYNEFPDVPKEDIRRILNFGWKSYYLHNSYGGDTFISDKNIWSYTGHLKKKALDHFYYYIKKLCIRIRVLYRRKKIKWDGYYYFALSNPLYENYLKQKVKGRGRPKKHFDFGTVKMYLILDECKLQESEKKYIFRVPYITTVRYSFLVENFKSDKAELIIERNPLKFEDILVYENKYEII